MPKRKAKYFNYSPKKDLVLFLVLCVLCIIALVLYISQRANKQGGNDLFWTSKNTKPAVPEEIYADDFDIFFDSFSGLGFIDSNQSSLYLNNEAASIMFLPDYSFNPITVSEGANLELEYFNNFNDFNGPYKDERCLEKNCLIQDGFKLSYNKHLLTLPNEIKTANLKAVSIAMLGSKWLVGFTSQEGEKYRGEVFSYDGKKFTLLKLPSPIISDYFGVFGFGGEDEDFLVIYGAYQGTAYRFRDKKVIDISKFFDIRVMKGGFKAEVIKTKNSSGVNWYIFSLTNNRARILKLWQNGTEDIAGEIVFDLPMSTSENTQGQSIEDESISFKLKESKDTGIFFSSAFRKGEVVSGYDFIDRGFKNQTGGILTFLPIYFSDEKPLISLKEIKLSQIKVDTYSADKIKLSFSADNINWREMPLGQNFTFKTYPHFFDSFRLRVVFPSFDNKFYSPFLEEIMFKYFCTRKE